MSKRILAIGHITNGDGDVVGTHFYPVVPPQPATECVMQKAIGYTTIAYMQRGDVEYVVIREELPAASPQDAMSIYLDEVSKAEERLSESLPGRVSIDKKDIPF